MKNLGGSTEVVLWSIERNARRWRIRVTINGEGKINFSHFRQDKVYSLNNRNLPISKYLREEAIKKLGNVCEYCGNKDVRVLQINHINGGGMKEYREKGAAKIYRSILNNKRKGEFNVLCANCNILYEYEVGRRITRK